MPSITDLLSRGSNGTPPQPTTLAADKPVSSSSCSLNAAVGWDTSTPVHFIMYKVDANNAYIAGTETLWKGILSGTTVNNLTLKGGTDADYPQGSPVELMFTSAELDDLITALQVIHNPDGTLKSGLALTAPTVSGGMTVAGGETVTGGETVDTLHATSTVTMDKLVKLGNATVASGATITPDAANTNFYTVTALAVGATIAVPTGTPVDGQTLTLRIKDNGSQQSLTWNAIYRAIGITIPTTTDTGKTIYVGMKYNAQDAVWDVLSVGRQ